MPCPLLKSELPAIVGKELKYHDDCLCHMLTIALKEQADVRKTKFAEYGRKCFGLKNFKRVVEAGKLPSLRDLISMASAIGLTVVYKNYPYKGSGARAGRDFHFADVLDEQLFISFLSGLSFDRYVNCDSQEMMQVRIEIMERLTEHRPRFDWPTLIKYSAACGYQFNIFLVAKKANDGCFTPNHSADHESPAKEEIRKQEEKWWVDKETNKETKKENDKEYQALLRRLDYPA